MGPRAQVGSQGGTHSLPGGIRELGPLPWVAIQYWDSVEEPVTSNPKIAVL